MARCFNCGKRANQVKVLALFLQLQSTPIGEADSGLAADLKIRTRAVRVEAHGPRLCWVENEDGVDKTIYCVVGEPVEEEPK